MNKARTFLKLSKTLTARVLSSLKNNLASCVLEFQINLVVLYFPGEHSLNFPTFKKNEHEKLREILITSCKLKFSCPLMPLTQNEILNLSNVSKGEWL